MEWLGKGSMIEEVRVQSSLHHYTAYKQAQQVLLAQQNGLISTILTQRQ